VDQERVDLKVGDLEVTVVEQFQTEQGLPDFFLSFFSFSFFHLLLGSPAVMEKLTTDVD